MRYKHQCVVKGKSQCIRQSIPLKSCLMPADLNFSAPPTIILLQITSSSPRSAPYSSFIYFARISCHCFCVCQQLLVKKLLLKPVTVPQQTRSRSDQRKEVSDTYTRVVSVPPCACGYVETYRKGECAEEDGGDEDGISFEQGLVDWLLIL